MSWQNKNVRSILTFAASIGIVSILSLYVKVLLRAFNLKVSLGNNIYKLLLGTPLTYILIFMLTSATGVFYVLRDIKNNGYYIYFSRPISVEWYVVSKIFSMAFLISIVTFTPAFIFFISNVAMDFNNLIFREQLQDFISILLNVAVISIPTAVIVIAFSSLSRSVVVVNLLWFAFYFGSMILSRLLVDATGNQDYKILSYVANLTHISFNLYRAMPIEVGAFSLGIPIDTKQLENVLDINWKYSLLLILGLSIIFFAITVVRLRTLLKKG